VVETIDWWDCLQCGRLVEKNAEMDTMYGPDRPAAGRRATCAATWPRRPVSVSRPIIEPENVDKQLTGIVCILAPREHHAVQASSYAAAASSAACRPGHVVVPVKENVTETIDWWDCLECGRMAKKKRKWKPWMGGINLRPAGLRWLPELCQGGTAPCPAGVLSQKSVKEGESFASGCADSTMPFRQAPMPLPPRPRRAGQVRW
jgi:hypothetical protein